MCVCACIVPPERKAWLLVKVTHNKWSPACHTFLRLIYLRWMCIKLTSVETLHLVISINASERLESSRAETCDLLLNNPIALTSGERKTRSSWQRTAVVRFLFLIHFFYQVWMLNISQLMCYLSKKKKNNWFFNSGFFTFSESPTLI